MPPSSSSSSLLLLLLYCGLNNALSFAHATNSTLPPSPLLALHRSYIGNGTRWKSNQGRGKKGRKAISKEISFCLFWHRPVVSSLMCCFLGGCPLGTAAWWSSTRRPPKKKAIHAITASLCLSGQAKAHQLDNLLGKPCLAVLSGQGQSISKGPQLALSNHHDSCCYLPS